MRHLVLAALALAAPAVAASDAVERQLARRVPGPPVSCVSSAQLRQGDVLAGQAIVYKGVGSRLYVNRPLAGAADLSEDTLLVVRSSGGQVCRNDVVDLVDRFSRIGRGFVRLGDFVPYDRPAGRRQEKGWRLRRSRQPIGSDRGRCQNLVLTFTKNWRPK